MLIISVCNQLIHYVKSVPIRSFFWSVFSGIWAECGDLLRKPSYSARAGENIDQNKLHSGSDVSLVNKEN